MARKSDFSFSTASRQFGFLLDRYCGLFSRQLHQAGCKGKQWLQSSAVVMNKWSNTSTSPYDFMYAVVFFFLCSLLLHTGLVRSRHPRRCTSDNNWQSAQGGLRLKCDGTRAETTFRLSGKRTSPFKWAGASVQLTTGSRGVRISCSNAGYTMFWGSVKSTGYPLHLPVSPSLPHPCVTVYHHISTGLYKSCSHH